MRRLYAAGPGEDRKQRLIRESSSRRRGMLEAMRSSKTPETPASSPPVPAFAFESFEELVDFLAISEADKWADSPEGSSQHKLAERFQKGGDLHKKAHE